MVDISFGFAGNKLFDHIFEGPTFITTQATRGRIRYPIVFTFHFLSMMVGLGRIELPT
jgi:hypothetical protein